MPSFFGDWNPLFLGCAGDLAAHVLYRINVPPRHCGAFSLLLPHLLPGASPRAERRRTSKRLPMRPNVASHFPTEERLFCAQLPEVRAALQGAVVVLQVGRLDCPLAVPRPSACMPARPQPHTPPRCPPRPPRPRPKLCLMPAGMSAQCAIASVGLLLRSTSSETMAIAVQCGDMCTRLAATTFDTAIRSWRLRSRSSIF
jgi:hypothetical protein